GFAMGSSVGDGAEPRPSPDVVARSRGTPTATETAIASAPARSAGRARRLLMPHSGRCPVGSAVAPRTLVAVGAGRFDAVDVGSDVVAMARAFAVAETRALGHDDLTDDVELVTSELTTNSVLHAGGVTSVRLVPMADGVRIEVRDRTRITPLLALASTEAMTGRGLRVVTAVAARWKAEPEAGGKVVWAELSAASGPAA